VLNVVIMMLCKGKKVLIIKMVDLGFLFDFIIIACCCYWALGWEGHGEK
jgi:hypothetical protein